MAVNPSGQISFYVQITSVIHKSCHSMQIKEEFGCGGDAGLRATSGGISSSKLLF
jgi:hypothetical protein